MADENKPDETFTTEDRAALRSALIGIDTGNLPRKEIIAIQKRMKAKYPNTYGIVRREIGNEIANAGMSTGGMPKKKKGPMQMAMGGMANGKKHMYLSNGGSVMDKLPNPGLKALAKTEKGKAAVRNMGFNV